MVLRLYWQLQFDEKNCENSLVEKIRESATVSKLFDKLQFYEQNCENSFVEKVRENGMVLRVLRYLTVYNFNLTRKIVQILKLKKLVKMQWFCVFWMLTTSIWRAKLWKIFSWKNSWKCNGFAFFGCWQPSI